MGPVRLASLGIHAVDSSPAIGNKDQTIVNGRRRAAVSRERIGPHLAIVGDIPGPGRIDALQPGLVLAPPDVTAYRDI